MRANIISVNYNIYDCFSQRFFGVFEFFFSVNSFKSYWVFA